jgi:MtaA/CmuA family methyltransferase
MANITTLFIYFGIAFLVIYRENRCMKQESFLQLVRERSELEQPLFHPILMQFAAHEIGRSYRDYYLDYRVLGDSWLECIKQYGAEAAMLVSDPGREAEAFGGVFEYNEETVPHCRDLPVRGEEDLAKLQSPDVRTSPRTRDRIEGARYLKSRLPEDIPLIGWVEGPLAEACDLAGVSEMLMKMVLEEDFSNRFLRLLVETAKTFAIAQIEEGCDIIGVGDAICSQISADMYRQMIFPLHRELFSVIHDAGALVKLHICGNITHLLPIIAETGVDIVDIDWQVDMDKAFDALGPDIIRCGNLDPAEIIERSSPPQIRDAARALARAEKGRAFILSGGCEITPLTPKENFSAMRWW